MPRKAEASAASELAAPRFAGLWAAATYALCTAALAYPALAGQFLVNPHSDQYIAGFAFRDFAAQSLKSGHGIPLWNPYLFGGLPYVAAMHGDIFYPTFLLRWMLPTDVAMTMGFAVHLFLAGMFTYAFLRAWGLSFFPSLIGGVAYMLSGQVAGLASPGHDGKLFVSALLPLVLWMLVRGVRDGRRWAWGGLSLSVGLAILSPHPQLFQYLLLTSGAFALFLAFAPHDGIGVLPRDVALKRLGLALGAVILGCCIGAIQFLPVREYVAWSPRSGGRDYAYATSYSLPIEELFNSYLPQFSGILDNYWGRNGIHLHSEYLGAIVLLLAGGAIGVERQRAFRRFWLGVFVVGVLWALGGSTPFYHLIYNLVPGTKYFRAPSTIYYVYAFAVAIFAAFGAERLLAGRLSLRYGLIWLASAGAVGVLISAGGATALSDMVLNSMQVDPQMLHSLAERADANAPAVVLGAWRSFLFVALAVALIWALSLGHIRRRAAAWILVGLVATDLWSIARLYWLFSPPASTLYASDPAIDAVRQAAQPGRVLALDLMGSAAYRDPNFGGDGLMVHQLRSVQGYHGNELGRYQQLLGKTAESDYNIELLFSAPVWRQENVQYLYTTLPDSEIPQLQAGLHLPSAPTKLLGPVKDASGSTVYLYRLPGDNPFAWVAPAAVKVNDDQAKAAVLDARFDPMRVALVDSATTIQTVDVEHVPAALSLPVHVTRYEPGRVDVDLATGAPAGAMLVLSENYYPGWRATSNGASLPVVRADFNLVGVQLTAGARAVDLRFEDQAVEQGRTVSILSVLAAVAVLFGGLALDRRAGLSGRSAT